MSWADENLPHFDGESVIIERAGFILNMLNTRIHENIYGEKIDVRTIDKRYANNLINWYWRRFDVLYRPLHKEGSRMSEIKFRALYNGKMYEVAKLDLWGDLDQHTCDLASLEFDEEELFDIYLNEVILMQFTGLKDKYGVEIYDRDIVKHHNDILSTVFYSTSHCAYLLQDINGNRNKCQFDNLGNYSSLWIEVIGNIYENPKLLEAWRCD